MRLGDIVICEFPFTNLAQTKIRPVVIVTLTNDYYKDIVVSLISSSIPTNLSSQEIFLEPTEVNNLRVPSIIKVSRLATVHHSLIISKTGRLTESELSQFVDVFQSLVKLK